MSLIKKYFLYSLHDCCYSGCLFCFHFQVVRVGQDSCLPPVLLPPLLFHFFFLFYRRGKKETTLAAKSSRNSNQIAVGCTVIKSPLTPQPWQWSELVYHQLPQSSSIRDQDPTVSLQTRHIHLTPRHVSWERDERLLQTTANTVSDSLFLFIFCWLR